jgi:hypothetical protein
VSQKYGIPIGDLPSHCLDAVDAAERMRARTLIVRGPLAVAAIVPMSDFDRIDPPDPGATGQDPLLALCGACRHDDFVDNFVSDLNQTSLWTAGRSVPPALRAAIAESSGPNTTKAGSAAGAVHGPPPQAGHGPPPQAGHGPHGTQPGLAQAPRPAPKR